MDSSNDAAECSGASPCSTPSSLVWTQGVDIYDGEKEIGFLCGPNIRLPIYPFPGLIVGALTVESVLVNQGAEDISGGELTYQKVTKEHGAVLEHNDWEWA